MALWEMVREIENQCARNQMRDVFFDEVETDDPLSFVRHLLKAEGDAELSIDVRDSGNCTVFADCSGVTQRFIFSKIEK